MAKQNILVAHLIYRFDVGGLERVMVNCINAMTSQNFQHVVIALTNVSDFSKHLKPSVKVYQLDKKLGKDLNSHWRLLKLLRKLKPDILHTYNLAAIEYHPIARLAGVKGHVHAEHGREISDPLGLNPKHNVLRRFVSPFIHFFVPVSTDLELWLKNVVNIDEKKVRLIRNGINTDSFSVAKHESTCLHFIHIARFNPVKDQANLLRAFAILINKTAASVGQIRLTLVGDGEIKNSLSDLVHELNLDKFVIFTGVRTDIAELLSGSDIFVLSSIAEGIPMTVLEAMASGLAIVSTNVGGLSELVIDGNNGYLVEKQNAESLALAMKKYVDDRSLVKLHGDRGLSIIENQFEESAVIKAYTGLYQKSLGL